MSPVREVAIPQAGGDLPGLWLAPPAAAACLVLAHGAGAGMRHRGMASIAEGLAERGIATLRFEFRYMAAGSRRPDPPPVAHAAIRAAAGEAARLAPDLPLFAGGRSFGGRMTSQAQAIAPLAGVKGLVFFAFPLHPAGKPSVERAAHLREVGIPMLMLQGSRDALAEPDLLAAAVADLRPLATLVTLHGADHAFHVPARSRRRDADVLAELLDAASAWMLAIKSPDAPAGGSPR